MHWLINRLSILGRVAGLAIGLVTGLVASESGPARVGVLTDNYPFSFRSEDGRIQGFAYELVAEIEELMALKFERVEGATSEINPAFVAGQLDILQSYVQFPERDGQADFSVPYLNMTGAIFVRDGENSIQTLADLKGRRVLVHRGSLGDTVLRRAGLADAIVYADSAEQAMIQVNRGEGDAVMVSRLNGLVQARRLHLEKLRALPMRIEGYDVRYCIAVRKGQPLLLAQINEGLAIIHKTGRFEVLYQKWFGYVEPKGYTVVQFMWAVAVGLALALGVATWAALKQRGLRKRIAQQAEELRISEERHRGIFEGAHDGLIVVTGTPENYLVEQINPAAIRLLAVNDARQREMNLAGLVAPDDALANQIGAAIAAKRVEEFEHQRRGGEWLRVVVSPLGRRALITLTDVTEQLQARGRLRQQEEQIRQKQKLEAVGTLAGGVAHDFNNLLTAIMGNTELCLLNLPAGHPEAQGLQQVMSAAKRARDLVRQILSFSRQATPGREVVAVRPLIDETINLLKTIARGTVTFEVEMAANLAPIMADPVQVHQVLMNIGTNAVQAMRHGPGRLIFKAEAVDVRGDLPGQFPGLRPGGYIRIAVQDCGVGMDQETQARVFEPFFTTKAQGEGTGLGLSVVHGIMQQHEGAVTLYSQVGRGTVFNLYFPAATSITAVPTISRTETAPVGTGELILLVDDEDVVADLVEKILTRLGYRVSKFNGAAEAWLEYSARPDDFGVILSDLTMPAMNGLQLLSRVRALRPQQVFVLTSGFFAEAERQEAVALGVTELMAKPLSYAEVGRVIAAAVKSRVKSA